MSRNQWSLRRFADGPSKRKKKDFDEQNSIAAQKRKQIRSGLTRQKIITNLNLLNALKAQMNLKQNIVE